MSSNSNHFFDIGTRVVDKKSKYRPVEEERK